MYGCLILRTFWLSEHPSPHISSDNRRSTVVQVGMFREKILWDVAIAIVAALYNLPAQARVWIPSSEWLYQRQTKPRTSHPSRSVKSYTTHFNSERACDCKPVLDHVSTPTTSGVLRKKCGYSNRTRPFFLPTQWQRQKRGTAWTYAYLIEMFVNHRRWRGPPTGSAFPHLFHILHSIKFYRHGWGGRRPRFALVYIYDQLIIF